MPNAADVSLMAAAAFVWWTVGLQQGLSAIIFFVCVFSAETLFTEKRIAITIDKKNLEITSIILPIFSCGTSAEFYPDGRSIDGATPEQILRAVEAPDCQFYRLLSRLIYLFLFSMYFLMAGILLGVIARLLFAGLLTARAHGIWGDLLRLLTPKSRLGSPVIVIFGR
jgi:hypothetical protein